MDKNGITAALRIVRPELVVGYQAKNLEGKSLSAANEECKIYHHKKKHLYRKGIILSGFAYFCMFAILVLGFTIPEIERFTHGLLGIIVLIVIWLGILMHRDTVLTEKIDVHEQTFADFIRSVKKMDHSWPWRDSISEDTVRTILGNLAYRLLEAEIALKNLLLHGNPTTEALLLYCNSEVECRASFEKMLGVAEKFGQTFSKAEKDKLFSEAKKRWESRI